MKTKIMLLLLFATLLLHHNAYSQEKTKDISYKLILEAGPSLGIERYYYTHVNTGEEIRTDFRTGLSLNAINNIAFKDRLLIGIGGGLEYGTLFFIIPTDLTGTCFFNFRYYFNKPDKLITPLLNIAIGGRMVKKFDGIFAEHPWHLSETTDYGIYSTLGAGFKIKRFLIQWGVRFWSEGNNLYGIDFMCRVGHSFGK